MLPILDFIVRLIFRRKITLPDPSLLPPGVELREGTWFLSLFDSGNRIVVGMTIANTILLRRGPLTLRTLMHELTHVRQWHKYGLKMAWMWIQEISKYNPEEHDRRGLEGEAEAEEQKYPDTFLVTVQ